MMQEDTHIFKGMKRDTHPIRQDSEFLWDAHNIRITARGGSTFMTVTNEKSTKEILKFNKGEIYIGHSVCGIYLVLFTKLDSSDYIYRINLDDYTRVILYKGNLNFDKDYPIQAISDFESEFIQKVYWTDGLNCPRVINIMKPSLLGIKDKDDYTECYKNEGSFNFIQELSLNEYTVVDRIDGNGIFPTGVIQYAFTYYHKYGQESNIFYTTELMYIAHNDRGEAPEKTISTAFNIKINNIQKDFDYVRVYSIIRTSIDAVPVVKRVSDIKIEGTSVSYLDTNTTGETIDPTLLLYIGGKDIVAQCIHSKDGVLFLGNIKYNRREVQVEKNNDKLLEDVVKELNVSCSTRDMLLSKVKVSPESGMTINDSPKKLDTSISFYDYINQLDKNTSTFKIGETYRLGLQFQYKNGEWSEPLHVGDIQMSGSVRPYFSRDVGYRGQYNDWYIYNHLHLPIFSISNIDSIKFLKGKGYKRVRPVIVMPENKDRSIIAQGILCPTVFNIKSRKDNSPYAQSSWMLRPILSKGIDNTTNEVNAFNGASVEYRHLKPLISGGDRGAEIQNMFVYKVDERHLNYIDLSYEKVKKDIDDGNGLYNSAYYVDNSIVTFHSPDIEFNDTVKTLLNNNLPLKVRVVGIVPFTINYGDINIQTSSSTIDGDARGYVHNFIKGDGSRSLVSGLFYEDSFVKSTSSTNFENGGNYPVGWMVHMWHRSGSLNNDIARPSGAGVRTSELLKKKIANIKYSPNSVWLKKPVNIITSDVQLFDSNEVSLIKFKDIKSEDGVQDINYYGNVDTLNNTTGTYRLITGNVTHESASTSEVMKVSGTMDSIDVAAGETPNNYVVKLDFKVKWDTKVFKNNILLEGTITEESTTYKVQTGAMGVQEVSFVGGKIKGYITSMNIDEGLIYFNRCLLTPKDSDKDYILMLPKCEGNIVKVDTSDSRYNFNSSFTNLYDKFSYEAVIAGTHSTLLRPKDPVRIKYKSTPHGVFASLNDDGKLVEIPFKANEHTYINTTQGTLSNYLKSYLLLAELYQEPSNPYGELKENLWIPAGPAVSIDANNVQWYWGDTWYQRYDCLKTYPFTEEDENQVIEIGSFMCETRVNLDGRYDRNRGLISNLNVSPVNFNLRNNVYDQKNTFFNYRQLDKDYYKVDSYPSQLVWSLVKNPADIQDQWTNLNMANSLDLDGTKGSLTSLNSINEVLVGFQEKAVNQILFNSRVQIEASDGVPIEISNSNKVEGTRLLSDTIGCQDKFANISTPQGIYFIDNNNDSIYKLGDGIENLSFSKGTMYWPRGNHSNMSWRFKTDAQGNNGIRLYYDSKYQDLYFTPGYDKDYTREALCYSEQLGEFISLMNYGGAVMLPYDSKFYSIAYNDKEELVLWENFSKDIDTYNNIFGVTRPYSLSFISNDNPISAKIFDTINIQADVYNMNDTVPLYDNYKKRDDSSLFNGSPFNYIRVSNEYQNTGKIPFNGISLRKKFRTWRALFPRQENTRNRILGQWAKVELGNDNPNNDMLVLHNISVKYTI